MPLSSQYAVFTRDVRVADRSLTLLQLYATLSTNNEPFTYCHSHALEEEPSSQMELLRLILMLDFQYQITKV